MICPTHRLTHKSNSDTKRQATVQCLKCNWKLSLPKETISKTKLCSPVLGNLPRSLLVSCPGGHLLAQVEQVVKVLRGKRLYYFNLYYFYSLYGEQDVFTISIPYIARKTSSTISSTRLPMGYSVPPSALWWWYRSRKLQCHLQHSSRPSS